MAIDPRLIKTGRRQPVIGVSGFVDHDAPCSGCGYNLVGLRADARCPECGRPIGQLSRRSPHKFAERITAAPRAWLQLLSLGSDALVAGALMWIGGLLITWMNKPLIAASACIMAAGAWYAGVWLLTRPRPRLPSMSFDPAKEWVPSRMAARVTQALWFGPGVAMLLAAASPGTPAVVVGLLAGLGFVGYLGLVALLVYLSNIAYWAGDSSLTYSMQVCTWLVGLAIPIGAVVTFFFVGPGGLFFGSVLAPLMFLLLLLASSVWALPLLYLAYCMLRLQKLAHWALRNHESVEDRNRRLRDKADRAAADSAIAQAAASRAAPPRSTVPEADVIPFAPDE